MLVFPLPNQFPRGRVVRYKSVCCFTCLCTYYLSYSSQYFLLCLRRSHHTHTLTTTHTRLACTMPPERPPPQHAQHSRHAACSDGSAPPRQQPHHHKPSSSARPRPRFRPSNVLMLAGSATFLLWFSTSWWTNLSPSLSPLMLSSVARSLVQQQQQPWVGPHALVPPLVDRTDSTINHHHVRIIIRVHHLHEHLVRGLIHNFRFQQRLLPSSPPSSSSPFSSAFSSSLRPTTLSMDFALVPTELAGVNVTQNIARSFWENPHDSYPHVYAVDLNEAFYLEAAKRAIPFRCSREMMSRVGKEHVRPSLPLSLPLALPLSVRFLQLTSFSSSSPSSLTPSFPL